MNAHASTPKTDAHRTGRVSAVVYEVLSRRFAGEVVGDDAILAAHPELMPELGSRLRAVRRIERARRWAGFLSDASSAATASRSAVNAIIACHTCT